MIGQSDLVGFSFDDIQSKTALWSACTWRHGSHIGVPKQLNSGHVGVPNQSCESSTLFLCKHFLFSCNKFAWLLDTWGNALYMDVLLAFITSLETSRRFCEMRSQRQNDKPALIFLVGGLKLFWTGKTSSNKKRFHSYRFKIKVGLTTEEGLSKLQPLLLSVREPSLESPGNFSGPENHSKISNLAITELFYSVTYS